MNLHLVFNLGSNMLCLSLGLNLAFSPYTLLIFFLGGQHFSICKRTKSNQRFQTSNEFFATGE